MLFRSKTYSPASAAYTYYIPAMPNAGTDYTVSNGNRTISVKLNPNAAFDGYKVDLYLSGTRKSTKTIAVTKKTATLTFSGLVNNSVYDVKVSGYKTVSKVKYYSAAASTPMAPMAVPTAPSLVTNDVNNTVTASWPSYVDKTVQLQYKASADSKYTLVENITGGSYTVNGLSKNTVYSFSFRWYNTACSTYSPWSAASTALILDKPVTPTHYTVSSGDRTITVKLYKNAAYDGYKIDIVASDGKVVSTKTAAVTKDTAYTFSKLTNNAVYTVKISGYKTVGKVKYYSPVASTPMAPMTVPTGLSLKTDDKADTVTASWTNYAEKKVELRYKEGESGTYTTLESTNGSETISLEKNKVYYFSFRWYNNDCSLYSPYSAESSVMILSTPEEKTATVGYKKIRVYFDDVDTLTGHQIKTYIVSSGKLVSTLNVKYSTNKTSADITKLTNGIEYKFEIRAYRTVGKTTYYSNPVTVTATPELKPVAGDKPTNVKASGGAKKITVSWTKDTWTAGHYIELYRTDNLVMVANAYAANSAASYTFSGSKIDYDVPYLDRVWKYNEKSPKAVGDSHVDTSAISLATPGSFAAAAGDKSITASWTYSGVAQNIKVYISTASGSGYTEACTAAKGTNSCTIEGLTNGTLYYVKAAAVYETGEGDSKTILTSADTAVKTVMPLPASSATVSKGSKQVTVSYAKDSTVTGHIIQLYKMSGTKAKLVKTVTNADKTDTVQVKFTGLSNGTTYRVTICSYKTVGKTTYRGAVTTYNSIVPSASSSASKELIGVSDLGEAFDGFVDPVDELNAQAEAEVKEEQQPSIFDLFRL